MAFADRRIRFQAYRKQFAREWFAPLRWIWRQSRPHRRRIQALLATDVLLAVSGVAVALVNKRLIDQAARAGGFFDPPGIVLLVFVMAVSVGCGSLTGFLSTLLHERFAFGMREKLYEQIIRSGWLPVSVYHTGDMITRLTGDAEAAADSISDLLPNAAQLCIRIIFAFWVLCVYEPLLAVCILAVGPPGALASVYFGDKIRRLHRDLKDNESAYRSYMQESLSHHAVVKAFQMEEKCADTIAEMRKERFSLQHRRSRLTGLVNVSTNGLFSLGYMLAFGWGIYQLARGEITYGTMSLYIGLASQVQGPIIALPTLIPKAMGMLASVGRLSEMDALEREPYGKAEALEGPVGARLDNVRLRYNREAIVQNATLNIAPGTHMGLVGESGAGKTTIARLLLGLIEPEDGCAALYDARGVRQRTGPETRSFIAYVPQGNTLFSGSIRENLRVGNADAADAEMLLALDAAEAGFVRLLPDGLDTVLLEHGGAVSEGQAQRIAIARALLRKSPLLILDEATSALDLDTERAIMRNLRASAEKTTLLIISHRPTLLGLCDCCCRLDGGVLIQEHDAQKERVNDNGQ